MSKARRGEMNFNDARMCFQQWQSCASCHPDGRADGLNWDLLNDGFGNPKNAKSMLFAHETPPAMITGIRDRAESAVRAGIRHIQFTVRPEEDAEAIDAYLKSLKPLTSPYLSPEGPVGSGNALERGKRLFEQAGCIACHYGSYFTDLKKYNLGHGKDLDKDLAFDTPSLREVWRTAPYLYDGRATTIREVLTTHNRMDRHGKTSTLTPEEIDALAAYVLSL